MAGDERTGGGEGTAERRTLDWGDGEYERTARQLAPAAVRAVERAAIEPGERVLDLGCGTGNAALEAARRGAVVTAVDPTPRLLEVARQRAEGEGMTLAFLRGEAAEPGVPDRSFDAALAVFSIIFAPDPELALAGILRTVRPGGRTVLTSWLPSGPIYESSMLLVKALHGGSLPPPSPWSDPAWLQARFEAQGATVTITEETLPFEAPSPAAWMNDVESYHPAWRAGRAFFADRPNDYARLRDESIAILRRGNEAAPGFRTTSRYHLLRADLPE